MKWARALVAGLSMTQRPSRLNRPAQSLRPKYRWERGQHPITVAESGFPNSPPSIRCLSAATAG